jgi:Protein of unknown function (DUF3987)/Bifunctional DNA primase/polymerase, N-terminal
MQNNRTPLDTALALLAQGLWPVVLWPLGAEIPDKNGPRISKGKEPIGLAWGVERPTEATIRATFRAHPDGGVGLRLGPEAGVIDLEGDGPEAESSLTALFGHEVPETLGWSSRRGAHRLFLWDDRLAVLGKIKTELPGLPGLEIRTGFEGKQAQSACPPTLGEDGTPRRWNGCDTIAPLPEAALRYLEAAMASLKESPYSGHATSNGKPCDPAAAWFRKALESECGKVAMAPNGERNDALNNAAGTLGGMVHHGYLTEPEIVAALTEAGRRAGLDDGEVSNTIRSGLEWGRATPLPWPNALSRPETGSNGRHHPEAMVETDDEWGPIRLGALPPAEPFPLDVLPSPALDLAEAAARSIRCPVDFPAVATLAAASGLIGRSTSLLVKDGYPESACLYLALVGGPSSGKTPALGYALAPLKEIGRELYEKWRMDLATWEQESEAERGKKPTLRRIDTTDPTTEALARILAANPRGGPIVTPDEMTKWVMSMNQFKGGKGGDRPFWLSVWSGVEVIVDRSKHADEPIMARHPFLTVAGGMTPGMLGELVEGKGREDGFTARILFAYPDRVPRPYSEEGLPERVVRAWRDLSRSLWQRPMCVLDGKPTPHEVMMTPEARREWARSCQAHRDELEADDFRDSLEGPWGKLETYAARLALILHLMDLAADPARPADDEPPELPRRIIDDAWRLVSYFKAHARRVYAAMGGKAGNGDENVQALLKWIIRNERVEFSTRDINHDLRRFRDHDAELVDALDWMTARHLIRPKGMFCFSRKWSNAALE